MAEFTTAQIENATVSTWNDTTGGATKTAIGVNETTIATTEQGVETTKQEAGTTEYTLETLNSTAGTVENITLGTANSSQVVNATPEYLSTVTEEPPICVILVDVDIMAEIKVGDDADFVQGRVLIAIQKAVQDGRLSTADVSEEYVQLYQAPAGAVPLLILAHNERLSNITKLIFTLLLDRQSRHNWPKLYHI